MAENERQGALPLYLRRIVTGDDADGRSKVAMEGSPPVSSAYEHIPGMMTRLVWATSEGTPIPSQPSDPTSPQTSHVPASGETRFIIATFPPDSVFAAPDFNGGLAVEENLRLSPGLAERFEPDGFHRTDSIDYGILLDGELCLELDDGTKTRLRQHDVVVQNGTRHAWRNDSGRPATMAFILIGGCRAG